MLSDGKHDCCGRSVLQTVTATAAEAATQKRLERKERRREGGRKGAEGETRIQPDRFGWCTAPKGNGSVSLC